MNVRRLILVAFAINMLWGVGTKGHAQPLGPMVPVQGQVSSRSLNGPAPGLTVTLVHEVLGRSAPSFTDANGRFGWIAIPVSAQRPYFLEVYWGQNLIYRQPIWVRSPTMLPTITL
jgi:hypothetical protein